MSPEFNNAELARAKMIEQQIRPWNVLDPNVLDLLKSIRREAFVPRTHRHLAFVDMEVPLPEAQVMLAPKVEARLLQELNLNPTDRVLEIGTGSGFMAALLARMSAHVLSVEKYDSLMQLAQSNLSDADITNVELVLGNGLGDHPRWAHVAAGWSQLSVPRRSSRLFWWSALARGWHHPPTACAALCSLKP